MKTKAICASLRELATMIEDREVLRFAAAGDCADVVISLRVVALGDELVLAVNQPVASAKQRMLRLPPSPQMELVYADEDTKRDCGASRHWNWVRGCFMFSSVHYVALRFAQYADSGCRHNTVLYRGVDPSQLCGATFL